MKHLDFLTNYMTLIYFKSYSSLFYVFVLLHSFTRILLNLVLCCLNDLSERLTFKSAMCSP